MAYHPISLSPSFELWKWQAHPSPASSIIFNQTCLLIYDIYQAWVPLIALVHRIPAVHFQTTGATASAFLLRLFKNRNVQFPAATIFLREFEMKKMISCGESTLNDGKDKERVFDCIDLSSVVILVKSCNNIESKYIEFLSALAKKKTIPVGSLVQDPIDDDDNNSKIMQWLNENLEPQACGEKTSVERALPEGYLDKLKGKGLILEGWAPQAKSPPKYWWFWTPKAAEIARTVVMENAGEDIRKKARELSERIQSNVEEEISAVVEQRWAEPRTRLQIVAY
ncbi:beta-D-glucosyl crocetin beta-1,6-glucosyltransferase-like [Coffea eugenioides]|uniref:beta-D-glucosyl crocetin beta-1,6-glucosyltransferase-like n=1 Tax=Coffea eugenioides TaxID=49369 RepID=UPI000F60805D|nr:beta-D-glucosyl crocetin beta-1,6-glucosyltransferase-like [Coffea eugenioides]XP_027164809.1 beta-D-glucosyl crocetin beta-1,6-glucosyltransferase-like [Coffea eugenioides]